MILFKLKKLKLKVVKLDQQLKNKNQIIWHFKIVNFVLRKFCELHLTHTHTHTKIPNDPLMPHLHCYNKKNKAIRNGKKERNMYCLFFFLNTMTVYLENKISVWILYIKKTVNTKANCFLIYKQETEKCNLKWTVCNINKI